MNDKSPHILNTSSNLLGFSFIVLSSLKGFGLSQNGYLDKIVASCVVIFALASFFSFISMRSKKDMNKKQFESIADYIFLVGLTIVMFTSILLSFDFITFIH